MNIHDYLIRPEPAFIARSGLFVFRENYSQNSWAAVGFYRHF